MRKREPIRTAKPATRKDALSDFANTSATIVHTAAEILEREIAVGLKAAQEIGAQMETALEKSPDLGQASLLEIIDRFEKDAQEAVSVLTALLRTLAKALAKTTDLHGKDDQKD